MPSLKEELASIEVQIEQLNARKRELYELSIAAPENEKLCSNNVAEMLAEPELFRSISYPFEVTGIAFTGQLVTESYRKRPELVSIRPCADEFGGKTFLGLYLGDYAYRAGCSHNRATGVLEIFMSHHNPAIWVPSLKRIVYGRESWWHVLESVEQLRAITNERIDGVWYVQAMRAMSAGKDADATG